MIMLVNYYKPPTRPIRVVSKKFPFDGYLYHNYEVYMMYDIEDMRSYAKMIELQRVPSLVSTFQLRFDRSDEIVSFLIASFFRSSISEYNSFGGYNIHLHEKVLLRAHYDRIVLDMVNNQGINVNDFLSPKIMDGIKDFSQYMNSGQMTPENTVLHNPLYNYVEGEHLDGHLIHIGCKKYQFAEPNTGYINQDIVQKILDQYYDELMIIDNRVEATNNFHKRDHYRQFKYGPKNECIGEAVKTSYGFTMLFSPWIDY